MQHNSPAENITYLINHRYLIIVEKSHIYNLLQDEV